MNAYKSRDLFELMHIVCNLPVWIEVEKKLEWNEMVIFSSIDLNLEDLIDECCMMNFIFKETQVATNNYHTDHSQSLG